MTPLVYNGGWAFGDYDMMPLAAFKFDQWYNRWEGNLHFPNGTCRVYLEVNPAAGTRAKQPVLFIRAVQGDTVIGILMRQYSPATGMEKFYGRINTPTPLALEGYVIPSGTRFVLSAIRRNLEPVKARYCVTVYLSEYAADEKWLPNYRTSNYRRAKRKTA